MPINFQEQQERLRADRNAKLAAQKRLQDARARFVDSLAAGYPVVQIERPRCPQCGAVATGRPQHSERDGDLSIQRRKCATCQTMFITLIQ